MKKSFKLVLITLMCAVVASCGTKSAPPETFESTVSNSYTSLDSFWKKTFSENGGRHYGASPRLATYEETGQLKCGGEEVKANNAVYCRTVENYIAYDNSWFRENYQKYGKVFVYMVMAHEFGHFVQQRVTGDENDYTIQEELQADCLAGAYIRAKINSGELKLSQSEMNILSQFIVSLGDPKGFSPRDDRAHGTGDQRLNAFAVGYNSGVGGCGLSINPYMDVVR